MTRFYARLLGFFLIGIGLTGFLLGERHFLGLTTVDRLMDMVRLVFGTLLLFGAYRIKNEIGLRSVMMLFGISYTLLALAGLALPDLGGHLAYDLTTPDNVLHLFTGVSSVVMTLLHNTNIRNTAIR